MKSCRVAPSSVRLLDNAQFKMGQALKPNVLGPKWKAKWADKAKKFYVTQVSKCIFATVVDPHVALAAACICIITWTSVLDRVLST
jgi:hypothetical protein